MTLASFIILVLLAIAAAAIFLELADMPGNIAKSRNHPQAEAIHILAWLGLLFGGVGWVVAMVWAKLKPGSLLRAKPTED